MDKTTDETVLTGGPFCVACQEPIRRGATRCPHCHAEQNVSRWRHFASTLKWLGGFTAILSLTLMMSQLTALVADWRERDAIVGQLVEGARLQVERRDYAGAWGLLERAMGIDPGSREASDLQVDVAMAWLRDPVRKGDDPMHEFAERLLPVLYRGTGAGSSARRSTVFAHIGLADHYRRSADFSDDRMGWIDVEVSFRRSLELDPGNVYAHTMWGAWILDHHNEAIEDTSRVVESRKHFQAALRTGRERRYVLHRQLWALRGTILPEGTAELFRVLNEVTAQSSLAGLDQSLRCALVFEFDPFVVGLRYPNVAERRERIIGDLGVRETTALRETFVQLADGLREDPRSRCDHYYLEEAGQILVEAGLKSSVGDSSAAVALYRRFLSVERHDATYPSFVRELLAGLSSSGSQ